MSKVSNLASGTVCAVVVTYNRKDLLRECLHELLEQTRAPEKILVVDNASSDGTLEMLRTEFPTDRFASLEVLALRQNGGGAGGFHAGMKHAAAAGFEWIWLMDDDTIPARSALGELLAARESFPIAQRPDLLASQVVWTDGSLHPMNVSATDERFADRKFLAAAHRTFPLRSATFVSLLIHRRFVEEFGLPLADYFIWSDDFEYTGRILRNNFGVAVPASVVTHKTERKHLSTDASPRFYYHVRNTVWVLLRSTAFSAREKPPIVVSLFASIVRFLRASRFQPSAFPVIFRGLYHGLARKPAR